MEGKFCALVGLRGSRWNEAATEGSRAQPFNGQAVPGGGREATIWVGCLEKAEWGVVEAGCEQNFLLQLACTKDRQLFGENMKVDSEACNQTVVPGRVELLLAFSTSWKVVREPEMAEAD